MNEQRYMDKSAWPRGPWDGEPDRVSWKDPATGLDCLARRNERMGFWCGYVAVPKGHPLFGKDYGNDALAAVEVHGGLTFASECDGDPERGICHRTEGNDEAFWFGFDCGHAWDLAPGLQQRLPARLHNSDDVYRELPYVREQCAALAGQLATVGAEAMRRAEEVAAAR